jgi:thiol:disulfide interchange protein
MRTISLLLLGTMSVLLLAVASGCADSDSKGERLPTARSEADQSADGEHQVDFVRGFSEALAEARQAGKPLLVFFSTPECIYCRQMFEQTFRDQQIVRLAENFVCVRVEPGEDPQLCKDFHIEAFPTVQFIASDGAPLQRVLGKKEPETLAVQMQAALDGPHARTVYRSGALHR